MVRLRPPLWSLLWLALAAPAGAQLTIGAPQVQQCDGSFATGGTTRRPDPQIRAPMQDAANGLRVGHQRPSVLPAGTRALYRFDGSYTVTASGCVGNTLTETYSYGSDSSAGFTLTIGSCTYTGAGCNTVQPTTRPPLPLASVACPAAPVGAGNYAIASGAGAQPSGGGATFGNSFNFTSNAYASAADDPNWDMPSSYALSAWIRTSDSSKQMIVSQISGQHFWGLGTQNGCILRLDSRESAADQRTYLACGGTNLADNNWHYIAAVRSNGIQWRYFIDGVVVSTSVAVSTIAFADSLGNGVTAPLVIGSSQGVNAFFNGRIDELRIQGGALSDDTLALEYNSALHKFSEDGGSTFRYVSFASPYAPNPWNPSPSNGTNSQLLYQPTVYANIGPSQVYVFMAHSSRTFSTAASSPFSVTVDKTPPTSPTLSASPSSPLDIVWSWTLPNKVCGPPASNITYRLYNSTSGAEMLSVANALSVGESFPGEQPNQLRVRHITATDLWGTSPLSASVTAYTLANPPAALAVLDITTGSALISWSANSNPGYTRWEVTYSPDNFTGVIGTAAALGSNFTGTSIGISGLSPGTSYTFRVRAFSGRAEDAFGNAPGTAADVTAFTKPAQPLLSGAALSETAIQWSWPAVPGASGYRLYGAGGAPLIVDTALLSHTSSALSINTAYGAELEAYNASGASLRTAPVFVFTLANPPASAAIAGVSSRSITVGWSPNGNPAHTLYEVNVATGTTFALVVATRTGAGASLTVDGLLPGTTYVARVRAFSGGQAATGYAVTASTRTNADPSLATAPSPPSAYAPAPGTAAVWQFDEGSGGTAFDSSGSGLHGTPLCLSTGCASTPTYAAGPPGLGTALSFTGLANAFVRVPDAGPLNFPGSISLAAWARPSTLAQPNGAALIAKGDGGDESFALDVFSGRYRFIARTTTPQFAAVTATSSIRAGHWDHVVGTYDAATGVASIYINGVLSNSASFTPANRVVNAHDLTIGSRQSGSGPYDLGFAGSIDSPRVISGALTPAQAQAEFAGSFPGAVDFGGLPGLQVTFPPDAFGAPAQIYASANPLLHPIHVDFATLADGLANLPTGQLLLPGSLVEIVPTVNGQPFTANLGSSATLSMSYADADGDQLVDGVSPPISASTLRLYTLDTTVIRWVALPTTVDTAARRVTATTPHFSIFALFGAGGIGSSLSQVRLYPNPWRQRSGGRFDAERLTFDRLPAQGSIRIYTLSGELVNELLFSGPDGGTLRWDGRNRHGRAAASGVYFAYVRANDGSRAILKFAIER